MSYTNQEYVVMPMSASEATEIVRFMINQEAKCPGDYAPAMDRLAGQYGVSRWTLEHLNKGKAKTCDVSLYTKLKLMLIDHCQREAKILLERAAIAQAVGANDDVRDIADEIRTLAARLEAAKSAAKGG